jgi:hypothetical protein
MNKIPCSNCGNKILPTTAKRNNGLCARCKKPNKRVAAAISIIMGLVLGAAGLGFLSFQHRVKTDGIASPNWPSTAGVVTERQLRNSGADSKSASYYAISYEYYVDATPYTGERVHFGGGNDWAGGKGEVGDSVVVYYDPNIPAKCVLVTGYQGEKTERIWFWFSVGFMLMGGLGLTRGLLSLLIPSRETVKKW